MPMPSAWRRSRERVANRILDGIEPFTRASVTDHMHVHVNTGRVGALNQIVEHSRLDQRLAA